jgi:hypothetical protein
MFSFSVCVSDFPFFYQVADLGRRVQQMEQQNSARLNDEYQRLCASLGGGGGGGTGGGGTGGGTDTILGSPLALPFAGAAAAAGSGGRGNGGGGGGGGGAASLPAEVLEEQMPGNIRKARHFVSVLNNVVQYLR